MSNLEKIFLSRRAYAERIGVAPSYIVNLAQQGRIPIFVSCPDCKAMVDCSVAHCVACGGAIASVITDQEISHGKIDPEIADRAMSDAIDPAKGHVAERHAEQRGAELAIESPPATPEPPEKKGDDGLLSFNMAKRATENYRAMSARLEFEERAGLLGPVQDMTDAALECARTARDQVLAIPDRVSEILAAETDPAQVHELLTVELMNALENLAADIDRDAARG